MKNLITLIHEKKEIDFTYFHDGYPVIEVGKFTYTGRISLANYDAPPPLLRIGKFCSIAHEVNFVQTRNHPYDFVTTYPLPHNLLECTEDEWWNAISQSCVGSDITKTQIEVGNDVWIGRSATILSGVRIGHGAVIGANSVIAKDVPPYAIVVGNPGNIIKFRFEKDQINELLKMNWWDWDKEKMVDAISDFMQRDIDMFLKKYSNK